MDETASENSNPTPNTFNWHIPNEELAAMSEADRAVYLNEKTSRLYDALSALVAGEGKITPREIDAILNPEHHPNQEDLGSH